MTMFDLRAAQEEFGSENNVSPTIDGLRFLMAKLALEQEDSLYVGNVLTWFKIDCFRKKKTAIFDYNSISDSKSFDEIVQNKSLGNLFEKEMWLFPVVDGFASCLLVVVNPSGVFLGNMKTLPEKTTKVYSIGNSRKKSM